MKDYTLTDDLDLAREIAREAGLLLRDGWENADDPDIEYKGRINLVTKYDKASENIIVNHLSEKRPEDSILGEESGEHPGSSNRLWCIDPLDGTTNFAHRLPFFTVSITLMIDGEPVVGVVYNPALEMEFYAATGMGAFLNGKRLPTVKPGELDRALILYGCGYDRRENPQRYIRMMETYMVASQGIRRTGSASFDCCLVACGQADAYVEVNLYPWDIAAGSLIGMETGCIITDVNGETFDPFTGRIMIAKPVVHEQLLELSNAQELFAGEFTGEWKKK
ncbi:inositol monophosphatase [Myxococcota bacterium]|nr:inositol monophosphatase [Myxococcota bacterium]MBU1379737.1 inositol monophosphatase [Myxococcota bacterium]MBU1496879.1 inositol monophosphatase [Myxococcota bacterium]